jgi:glycosyltransferase involved in cell wall biosynthesis
MNLHLVYWERASDRWLPYDRYPRAWGRRIVRGVSPVSGMQRWHVNLRKGLSLFGQTYDNNDWAALKKTAELACVIGRSDVLDYIHRDKPILFGPATFNHPCDRPAFMNEFNVRRIIVSCEWMKKMFESVWPDSCVVWAAGIDAEEWSPSRRSADRDIDVLIYNKIRWRKSELHLSLIKPIVRAIESKGLSSQLITYGSYEEDDYKALLLRSKSMIFLCEHETQGFALQQALACDVPVLAWDREEYWMDETYYPNRVTFGPVSSVPYWDERCGSKFVDWLSFERKFPEFWCKVAEGLFRPREFVRDKLDLAQRAMDYVRIVREHV